MGLWSNRLKTISYENKNCGVGYNLMPFFYKYFAFHPLYTLTNSATNCKIKMQASKNREKCSSWSNVLYERKG